MAQSGDENRLFTLLSTKTTGVRFENRLTESRELNVFTYRNFYNGGGVGIGDLNGDGRPDIVLTSNHDGVRLFLNEGDFHFRDATKAAHLTVDKGSWTTGVAIADVNGDGLLDIYLCRAGMGGPELRANQLWINQGPGRDSVPTFKEMAKEYGVADPGYSTQAVFLDYDRDGDLDLFVIDNSPRPVSSFRLANTRSLRDLYGGAKLYRNDGGHFTEVGEAAGIHSPEIAFGLGVVVTDVNHDGWPDIYASNDFFERDYLYINNHDGTFTDAIEREMPAVSYFSMGVDAADVDNDGWSDVYTTDMLPEDEYRLKMTTSFEGWDQYQQKVQGGFHHQLMRNMLQHNNRNGTFSDVGMMAGVARTDWSWSTLIADLDLDGRKDIFVTNGLAKDITSQDYLAFLANDGTVRAATQGGKGKVDFLALTKAMTSTPIANYAFHNLGGLHFANEASSWGLATPSFSSGAAYGDLDGDGAPDLVVNNVNGPAFVYRNNARRLHPENHFLEVKLDGVGGNRFAIGARVTAYVHSDSGTTRDVGSAGRGDSVYVQEQSPMRGFQSSVDYTLVFGLGGHRQVDSLDVDWPDGRETVLRNVGADRRVTVRQSEATGTPRVAPNAVRATMLTDVTSAIDIDFTHRENTFSDFDREPLIPKLVSIEGPALAVADVNGDGLDDIYFGGAKDQPGKLMIQRRDGSFASSSEAVFTADAISEDVGATFFDANGDGRPDLYVVSGGNEYSEGATALQDRLYINDGNGKFHKADGYLPPESSSGSRVAAADYDGDGHVDLFVGGRVVPWGYGVAPQSMLLHNDGTGHFTDVTAKAAPELAHVGMVTDAVWRDVDGDGKVDLVVVGEWMPITVFRNVGAGKFQRLTVPGLEQSNGWWNRIVAGDFNGDGRVDFVIGNLGLNSRLHASPQDPMTMYVKDFDGNGSMEQIVALSNHGVSYPLPVRDDLLRAIPSLEPRYKSYKDYARQTVTDVFTAKELADARVEKVYTLASSMALNNGDGSFTLVPLPDEAQLAPIYGMLAIDVDRDGHTDLVVGGNFDGFKPEIGRMAASYGLVLLGAGELAGGAKAESQHAVPFRVASALASGFEVPGQTRDIARVRGAGGDLVVVARNNDRPLVFRVDQRPRRALAATK